MFEQRWMNPARLFFTALLPPCINMRATCASLTLTLSCACGPSQAQGETETPSSRASDGSSSALTDSLTTSEQAPPLNVDCSDGTCFSCGEGICPQGSFCDQTAKGGPACAWLNECNQDPSCGCITKILGASCSCDDSNGPTVSCQ